MCFRNKPWVGGSIKGYCANTAKAGLNLAISLHVVTCVSVTKRAHIFYLVEENSILLSKKHVMLIYGCIAEIYI